MTELFPGFRIAVTGLNANQRVTLMGKIPRECSNLLELDTPYTSTEASGFRIRSLVDKRKGTSGLSCLEAFKARGARCGKDGVRCDDLARHRYASIVLKNRKISRTVGLCSQAKRGEKTTCAPFDLKIDTLAASDSPRTYVNAAEAKWKCAGLPLSAPPVPNGAGFDPAWKAGYKGGYNLACSNLRAPNHELPYFSVRPAPKYPAVYLWDSAFIAEVWRPWNPAISKDIIRSVLHYQLPNGRVSHVVSIIGKSPLTQPPVLSWSAIRTYRSTGDKAFLAEIYRRSARITIG